jgi:hypothetical protein
MPQIWTDDPTIGSALGGLAQTYASGPQIMLNVARIRSELATQALQRQQLQQQMDTNSALSKQAADQFGNLLGPNPTAPAPTAAQTTPPTSATAAAAGDTSAATPIDTSQLDIFGNTVTNPGDAAPAAQPTVKAKPAAALPPIGDEQSFAVKQAKAQHYQTLYNALIVNHNYEGAEKVRKIAELDLGGHLPTTDQDAAIAKYQGVDVPDALILGGLENKVKAGQPLTPLEMSTAYRIGNTLAPAKTSIVDGNVQTLREQQPWSPGMVTALANGGFDVTGARGAPIATAATPTPGAPGLTPPAAAGPAAAPTPTAGGLPTTAAGAVSITPTQQGLMKYADEIAKTPTYQDAKNTTDAAAAIKDLFSQPLVAGETPYARDQAALEKFREAVQAKVTRMGPIGDNNRNDMAGALGTIDRINSAIEAAKNGQALNQRQRVDLMHSAQLMANNALQSYQQEIASKPQVYKNALPQIAPITDPDWKTFGTFGAQQSGAPAGRSTAPAPMLTPQQVRRNFGLQ